jgi:hypothetical protein
LRRQLRQVVDQRLLGLRGLDGGLQHGALVLQPLDLIFDLLALGGCDRLVGAWHRNAPRIDRADLQRACRSAFDTDRSRHGLRG